MPHWRAWFGICDFTTTTTSRTTTTTTDYHDYDDYCYDYDDGYCCYYAHELTESR